MLVIAQTQNHLKNINYLTVKSKVTVKLRSRWHATHQIIINLSWTTKKLWLGHENTLKYQLFELEVKGQGQHVLMMAHDTPSDDHTPACQISLTYRKRQKSYSPTYSKFANPFKFNNELTPFFVYFLVKFYLYLFYLDGDPPIF